LGHWEWLPVLNQIPLGEAPIENTLLHGATDSYGAIEFLMIPTVQYNVTVTAPGYTFSPMYMYPHDNEYVVVANSNLTSISGWMLPNEVGTKTFNVTSVRVSGGLGAVTIFYNDTGASTTGGFVNISTGATQLYSIPVTGNDLNETRNITIGSGGTSVIISARILTTKDPYKKDVSVSYPGQPIIPGSMNADIIMYTAFALIFFTSLLTVIGAARHVSALMCFECWVFLSFGWFDPLVTKIGIIVVVGLFSLATLISIIWNLRDGFHFET
jgi:hypothetical protein